MERLQKVIASSGVASRRKAEEMIQAGRVKVDGQVVTKLGTLVGSKNTIEVDGVRLEREEHVYYLLNKPRGIITSTTDDKHRKTVVDLIDTDKRIYPVGRLDYDTTGALILTNDGEFTNYLMHPSSEITKTYVAKVKGILKGKEIHMLESGVYIDGKMTEPAKVKLRKVDEKNNTCMVEITIHEGRNHQIKNMIASLGMEVLKLKRERIAFLDVKGLQSGEYRLLSPKEIAKFYGMNSKHKKNH